MDINALARPEILAMKPYQSARSSAAADGVLLNANEAPDSLLDDPVWSPLQLHRYPKPQPDELVRRLSEVYGVAADRLLITRGSDEGIDLLVRVFCRAGHDAILECPPCFGMYRIAAQIQGAEIIEVDRDAQTLKPDIDAIIRAIESRAQLKLVFLTNPNNPTGDVFQPAELKRILDACLNRAMVVLDEAYIEFCTATGPEMGSATALLDEYPNLVILRTLSKAWAAAGLRCGSVLARAGVISLLGRVMAPYPLTAPAVAVALAVTDPVAGKRQRTMLATVQQQKQQLLEYLREQPWVGQIWAGQANFVLVRVASADALVAHCAAQGVRIRNFSHQRLLEGCVRFSIGNAKDMQALKMALDDYEASE